MIFLLIVFLAVYQAALSGYLMVNPDYFHLNSQVLETPEFRQMALGLEAEAYPMDYDRLTTLIIKYDFNLENDHETSPDSWKKEQAKILRTKPQVYERLKNAYQTVLQDISCFPVPRSMDPDTPWITYENDFGDERTYGGSRTHEGTDILGGQMPPGFYPVFSMTGGVIEKAGWLELGGWRIGIRAPSGAYLYYAHLYNYSQDWAEGDEVQPGTLLGFMGDSGYGPEGTTGMFPVHLHLGIYLPLNEQEEISVNPYWILRRSEVFIRSADYSSS